MKRFLQRIGLRKDKDKGGKEKRKRDPNSKKKLPQLQLAGTSRAQSFTSPGHQLVTSRGYELSDDDAYRSQSSHSESQQQNPLSPPQIPHHSRPRAGIRQQSTLKSEYPLLRIDKCVTIGRIDADVHAVAISPDNADVVSASGDKTLRVWGLTSGGFQKPMVLYGHSGSVTCVAYSPSEGIIVSGSSDKSVKLWDQYNGRMIQDLRGHMDTVTCLSFTLDGKVLASGSDDRTVRLWASTGSIGGDGMYLVAVLNTSRFIRSLAFSPDGPHLACGHTDFMVRVWDLKPYDQEEPKLVATLEGHNESVDAVAFSPKGNGSHILSASNDKTLILWDWTRRVRNPHAPNSSIALGPMRKHTKYVTTLAISPDGRYAVSGSLDCDLCVWDLSTGRLAAPQLKGHTKGVLCVAWSSDGESIVSSGRDAEVLEWRVAIPKDVF